MSSRTRGEHPTSKPSRKAAATGATQPRSRGRRVLKWVLFTLLSLFALGCVGIAIAYATIDPPKPNQLANAQASIVYYDDSKTELARISDVNGNRESVNLATVPDPVQKAVLAAEDRTFYTNKGVSPTGIARAIWDAARGADTQSGGSTITQQYVKNYFLTQDKSLTRKGKEIIVAVKIDQQQSKDEILQNYLNTIYYGRGAYGIQTASKAYFGKDASQLTVAEGAVLASVINAPSLYDPALGTKQQTNLQNRFGYVLDGMVTEGWLGAAERATITTAPPTIAPQPNKTLAGTNGYLVNEVRKELVSGLKLSDSDIDRGGLRITTTISKQAQDGAVAAMDKDFPKDAKDVYAGLAAVRPGDGAIVAMYGGADYQTRPYNSATDAMMQAGSTFKPFALIAALQQGISTKTTFDGNSPLAVPGLGRAGGIENEGNTDYGMVDLRKATAKSINTVFVGLNEKIGPKATHVAAVAAGIPSATAGLGDDLTNVLGTASPRVLDVASAYATIAAQGQRAAPYLVAAVTSDQVNIDYKAGKQLTEAFPKDVAADVIDALQQVTAPGGTASRADIGRPVAGKTGTSEERKSVWFTGFVPQLSVSVGIYKDVGGVPQPLQNIGGITELSGNSIPLSIWKDFMTAALNGVPPADFPQRAGVGDDKASVAPPATTATNPPSTTTTPPPTTTTAPPTTTLPPPTTTTPQPTTTTAPPTTTLPPVTTTAPPATTRPPVTTTAPRVTTTGPSTKTIAPPVTPPPVVVPPVAPAAGVASASTTPVG
ncbi:transglycosylase domain-containing protein [Lapillicoccus sp.]|uniref:transglycosylase domain-containing protein n=1 Tax=Lapillicoccus sp. TaxID=1909287 RepID=UPI0039830CDE